MNFLEQFSPKIIPVRVVLAYGATVDVNMYSMTMNEWDNLGESVVDPDAPFVNHNSRGEEIRSYTNPQYLKERRIAESERAYKRLTLGLVKGGNDIPGVLFEEKVKAVKENMDVGVATALMRWQVQVITESRVRVLDSIEQFPSMEKTNSPSSDETGNTP